MRRIIDYKDIRRLGETTIDSLIKNGVVVTATADLAEAMDDYYADYRVIDIHGFLDVIIKQWQSNIKDVKNYVVLRNSMWDMLRKCSD